jgi:hypothetical protein
MSKSLYQIKAERTIPASSEKRRRYFLYISSSVDRQENLNTVKPLEPWKEYWCPNTTERSKKNTFFVCSLIERRHLYRLPPVVPAGI